jgi:uncharacterized membrane protein YqjE
MSVESTPQPIGALLKDLTIDLGDLVREETALAKLELRTAGTALTQTVLRATVGAALSQVGLLALAAALVMWLGDTLDGRYWLSALLVGLVTLVIGLFLGRITLRDLRRVLAPDQTIAAAHENVTWAKHETKAMVDKATK